MGIRIFLLVLLIFNLLRTNAQADQPGATAPSPRHRWVAKWAPLSVLDQEPTGQVALERAWTTRWSGQLELGYGWFNPFTFIGTYNDQAIATWRLRPEVRYYFARASRANYQPAPQGIYLAVEGLAKHVRIDRQTEVARNGGAFFESLPHTAQRWVLGGHVKLGLQGQLGRRIFLDGYLGFGARHIQLTDPDNPLAPSPLTRIDVLRLPLREAGQLTTGSVALGFKIGYGF
jgi:hypothetical protein